MRTLTWRMCAAVFLSSFCFFMAVPLVPLYIIELDPTADLAGPTIAISFVLSALLSPVWGSLATRYGPKPMLLRAAGLVSAAYAFSAWATTVDLLFVSRCVAGIASGFVPVATTTLVRLSDERRRSTDMGWLSSAKSAGALLGPSVGGLLVWGTGSFRVAFLAAALASLATVALAVSLPSLPPERSTTATGQPGPEVPSRSVVVPGLLLTFLLTAAGMSVQLWLPFALSRGRGAVGAAGMVGVVLALAAAASMVLAPVWGRLADRRRRGETLVATILLPIPIVWLLGIVHGPWLVSVLFVASAAFGSEAVALLGGEVSRRLPGERIGSYFGWSNTFTQLGSACAAGAVPVLAARSVDLPIWACVTLYIAGAVVVLVLFRTLRASAVTKEFVVDHA